MRYLGWIISGIGSMFALNGLITLVGGKQILRWAERRMPRGSRPRWGSTIRHSALMQPGMLTALGINNLLAGLGMLIAVSYDTATGGIISPGRCWPAAYPARWHARPGPGHADGFSRVPR